jgi:ABC-2 type transport system permease protein
MKRVWVIARKELSAYFGSLMALMFVGVFLAITLAVFFWVKPTFFARNLADIRPLFRWMPVLTMFLVAALTMRQWSEEQRSGTMEVLLTLPVRRFELVLGKFLAVMALVALSLALTLFLPITVGILGDLDWGPVVGGYLAAILMASAYAAIGLFVSSRTDNQIVSLIVTAILGGLFYLAGTAGATNLVSDALGRLLQAVGTSSRFDSIERGVIDLRDLVYYLSLTAFFLLLNVISLDAKRWSRGPQTAAYRRQVILTVLLVAANLVALNTWLFPLAGLRADLTADREYSLSPTTRDLITNLPEPLLVRAYISEETHELLKPLVPEIRDMLREYEVVSRGKVKAEVVDPRNDEALEVEANQVYGIQPTPFRISDRYRDSIINSYFDILIRYGDQHVILNFADLIEVESQSATQVDVRLRNLEYDLTRSIKKVVYGFQSLDAVFASIEDQVKLTALVTPDSLPEGMEDVPQIIENVARDLGEQSGGKFTYELIDPDAAGSAISRNTLINTYGIYPISVSIFSPDSYYLHLLLEIGDEGQWLYPGALTEADIRTEIEAALKRAAPGFLKTVGLWLPDLQPVPDQFGQGMVSPISSWDLLQSQLSQDFTVQNLDLTSGWVPGDVDVLLVIAPQTMSEKERFAIDQYLMRGGAVIVAAGNYMLPAQQFPGGLYMDQVTEGLKDLLASYGIAMEDTMVLDPQNEPLPIQVPRQVAGMQVYEIQELEYPYFVDVRSSGMTNDSPIVSNLSAVTLQWTSPLVLDEAKNANREVTVLLESTDESWVRNAVDVMPDPDTFPPYGFPVESEQKVRPLAVSIQGSFDSYYKDHTSPFQEPQVSETEALTDTVEPPIGTIAVSPESSRLVVIGSGEFIDDAVLDISQSLYSDRYLNNLQFVQNAVDWAVEDIDLLNIRSRGTYARLLKPLEEGERTLWESLNYAVALAALVAIAGVWHVRRRSEQPMILLEGSSPENPGPKEQPPSKADSQMPDGEGDSDE